MRIQNLVDSNVIYLLKVDNKNTRRRCEICSKLTYFTPCSSVSIVNFESVTDGWETSKMERIVKIDNG